MQVRGARLSSETAGAMIDRLRIFALKITTCADRPCVPAGGPRIPHYQ